MAHTLNPGCSLDVGDSRISPNGRYSFIYQDDGNLVLYSNPSRPLWSSNTDGRPPGECIMQRDGNLVIYGPQSQGRQPFWNSGTQQYPGSRLLVQDDGNVVIYQPDGTPVWATSTMQ
jgi:hypothetical protein